MGAAPENVAFQSLVPLFRVLGRAKGRILLVAILFTSLAALLSLVWPKTYRASALLLIAESKTGSSSVVTTFFNPKLYGTYRGIISNQSLAQRALTRFDPEGRMTVPGFLGRLKVRILRDSRLIEVSYRDRDPGRAAEIANFVAAESIVYNQSLNRKEIESQKENLSQELAHIVRNYERSKEDLREFKASAQIKRIEAEIAQLLDAKGNLEHQIVFEQMAISRASQDDIEKKLSDLRGEIQRFETERQIEKTWNEFRTLLATQDLYNSSYDSLGVEIAGLAGELKATQEALAAEPTTVSLSRALRGGTPPKSASGDAANLVESLKNLELREAALNPAHQDLLARKSALSSALAGLQERKARLSARIPDLLGELREKENAVIEYDVAKDRLLQALDLLKAEYNQVHEATLEGRQLYLRILENSLSEIDGKLEAKQRELAENETKLAALELDHEINSANLQLFGKQSEQMLLSIAEKLQTIAIIADALPPEDPIWPRKKGIVGLAFMISLLGSACFFYAKEIAKVGTGGPGP